MERRVGYTRRKYDRCLLGSNHDGSNFTASFLVEFGVRAVTNGELARLPATAKGSFLPDLNVKPFLRVELVIGV